MAVQIQELEVVPPAPAPGGSAQGAAQTGQPQQQQAGPPSPALERRLEHAARIRRARDQRLHAD
jgi:hypothetical protein